VAVWLTEKTDQCCLVTDFGACSLTSCYAVIDSFVQRHFRLFIGKQGQSNQKRVFVVTKFARHNEQSRDGCAAFYPAGRAYFCRG
jgi:hypothetical protein